MIPLDYFFLLWLILSFCNNFYVVSVDALYVNGDDNAFPIKTLR